MDKLFLTILNSSLTGAFVIAAICVARLMLKKAPKIVSYCLWTVAGFRLVVPFSVESVFSLIPFKAQTIPIDIALQPIPRIDSGISFLNNAVSAVLPAATPAASVNPLQIWTIVGAWVWIAGAAAMVAYGLISYIILKRKMGKAICIEANIHAAENIGSPFVLGVFRPKIYLPTGLSEQEKSYIILHEQTHIRRHDHIVKLAAYFVLCLHWFNPLVWVAFLLMGADMEMSCDERVLKEMGGETKKAYSLSLLSLATERRAIGGSPLAFGEGDIKERVKNVLKYRKASRIIVVAAVAAAIVLSIGFALNRKTSGSNDDGGNSTAEALGSREQNYNQSAVQNSDEPKAPKKEILDKIYLGMPAEEVYELLGEPDNYASGVAAFSYNGIGTFGLTDNFVDIRLDTITAFNGWNISDLVDTAMMQRGAVGAGEYPTHSYLIIDDIEADPNSFTVRILSLYETFLPDGEYDVRRVTSPYLPTGIELTFAKNTAGDYELAAEFELDSDIENIQTLTERLRYTNDEDAMHHFVGATPSDIRFAIGVGTAAMTAVAAYNTENGCFFVEYFPGATLRIEEYNEQISAYKAQSWIIEYTDKSKNIKVGREGTGIIPISDDMVGIYSLDEDKYDVRFTKYGKAE